MSPELSQTDICVALARIEEKLDAQNQVYAERFGIQNAEIQALKESRDKHGERMGKLEAAEEQRRGERKVFAGVMAVVGAIFGFVGSLILKLIGQG